MSSFKRLHKSDVFSVPYVAHKQWTFQFSSQPVTSSYAILYEGLKVTSSFSSGSDVTTSLGEYKRFIYDSMNHLFYQKYSESILNTQSLMLTAENYISASSQRNTSSYFNYNENPRFNNYFPTHSGDQIQVISVSKEIYGEKIQPGTFIYQNSSSIFTDDGNGNLFRSGNNVQVGNIFYSHGLAIITNQTYQFQAYPVTMSFKNEYTIYENYIMCTIEEKEYNLTYNRSILQDSTSPSSSVKDFATGSIFTPYVTTIGLYNDNNELLMVAKLAQPIPISPETNTTFQLRYDL